MDDRHREARNREYYAQRTGRVGTLSFEQVKVLFKDTWECLVKDHYLLEAMGWRLGNESHVGIWGHDPSAFILKHLRLENVWPIERHLSKYDQSTFFSVVEFTHDYVSKPLSERGPPVFEKDSAQREYRKMVNEILELLTAYQYSEGRRMRKIVYELSEDGEIREKLEEGFEKLIDEMPETSDPENIDDKIQYARSRFLRHSAGPEEKKDAVRTLGDILEFLRDSDIKMAKPDDSDLFKILNKFSIRHHKKEQRGDYTHDIWYEFMFYLFLASINVLLKMREIGE
ncbi:MAG: hypothetical protein ACW99U_01855 [Candidatus Thorarchaeota archaeon]